MQKSLFAILLLVLTVTLFSWVIGSCRKTEGANHLFGLRQVVPDGFPPPHYTFNGNPLTKEGFELGRKLFYDGRLSIDSFHPCASCHQQIAGFGTFEHDRSHGVFNSHTLRNAPVLFNLAWNTSYHWDGEFSSLEEEASQPINGHVEMGESFQSVVARIQGDPQYRKMFKEVFGYPVIRPEFILKALAQFTAYLVSADSKYDRAIRGSYTFTASELNGYRIYQANCSTCHPEPLFTDYSFRNTGLTIDPLLNDYGRYRVTGEAADSLKFKVPTLRNVSISENYMHDGRYNTLGQVINHYRSGIQQSSTLDPLLKNGITLSDDEAADLSIFLRTLTDSSFITDPRYAAPR